MPTEYIVQADKWLTDAELCAVYQKRIELDYDPYWRERFDLTTIPVLGAGLRVSEILEIYLEPTDGHSYCQLVEGPEGQQARLYLFGTKGRGGGKKGRVAEKRHRLAQVIPEAIPAFKRRYEARIRDGHKFLFSRPDGYPYRRLAFEDWWYQVMRLCGIHRGLAKGKRGGLRHKIPSIHCGRHSFATWEIASRRLNHEEVAAQIGNNPETTRTCYQHAIMESLFLHDKTPMWRQAALSMFGESRLRVVKR